MIDLYTWSTPNGRRAPIMLEECGLAYTPHYLELAKHEHKTEEMKKINWDQRIPVIVDPEGPDGKPIAVSESCAILMYLACSPSAPMRQIRCIEQRRVLVSS